MEISVFGLGYVGCVSAACLAADGHHVIGIDINPVKVDEIANGVCPIVEPGLDRLIADSRRHGRLTATTDARTAILNSQVSFVCIQTPSAPNGSLDLQFVVRVAEEIGNVLREKDAFHIVVFRSTMLPGTMASVVIPALTATSGKTVGKDFGIVYHPEFLREGSALCDYRRPPRTVIGSSDANSGDLIASLYDAVDAPLVRTDVRTAELVKYADNAFHALKVGFANEIGAICRSTGVNSQEAMRIFCLDNKLNLSSTYLTPGYAFGGSCLPKDLRALSHIARTLDIQVPILEAILHSNAAHKQRALEMVMAHGKKPVGFLGLSFKAGTDDLRESPTVELVEQLIGKGYSVSIYDPDVSLTRLMGSNKAYIDRELPHIASLLTDDSKALMAGSDILVVTKKSNAYATLLTGLRPGQSLIDLVRAYGDCGTETGSYHAIVG